MNRRELLSGTGLVLSLVVAGCSSDQSSANNSDENESGAVTVAYNWQRYNRLTTPDSEGVYYESTDEKQYVGVQLNVTNETDSELSIGEYELSMLADGSTENVSLHAQSQTGPLESIGADETVETWVFYIVPPNAELEFGTTDFAEHSFDLERDDSLEIALEEYEN